MTHRTIRSDGIRLRVHDQGKGPALLLAHGMWCDQRMFDDMVAALGASRHTIRLDLRGHGQSQAPRRPWSVVDLARDMDNTLEAFSRERAVVVGHSLGGMAALHMALRCPHRLQGLVLIGTSAEAETVERQAQLNSLALTIRISGIRKWMLRFAAEAFFSADFRQRHPERIAQWCRGVQSMHRRALVQALQAVRQRPSVADRLKILKIPALVVCGANDAIAAPAHAQALTASIPGASLVVLPDAGHALPFEKPRELAAIIDDFLAHHGLTTRNGKPS